MGLLVHMYVCMYVISRNKTYPFTYLRYVTYVGRDTWRREGEVGCLFYLFIHSSIYLSDSEHGKIGIFVRYTSDSIRFM